MDPVSLIIFMGLVLMFALVCRQVQNTIITPPMVFLAAGIMLSPNVFNAAVVQIPEHMLHVVAELTLILVLFTDAARIRLGALREGLGLPLRLLGLALPVSIVFGAGLALFVFPGMGLWQAALLAAMLCPTDAALGQAVVSNEKVPTRIRQALNVESGLNDGLCLPLVVFFAACAGLFGDTAADLSWPAYIALQLGLGPVVGVAVGFIGAKAVDASGRRGWSDDQFQQYGILAVALLSYAAAEAVGGNGFIAAFAAGLSLDFAVPRMAEKLSTFTEREGQLLVLITFAFFGVQFTGVAVDGLNGRVLLYAVLALTVIRMLPVWLSLAGTGLQRRTKAFLAWFGPRGMASMIYVLLIAIHSGQGEDFGLFPIVLWTVFLSTLLHGLTAAPAAQAYARHCETCLDKTTAPEHQSAPDFPVRMPFTNK